MVYSCQRNGLPNGVTEMAYKGYLIKNILSGGVAISKDGHHIAYAQNATDAKSTIDLLA